MTTFETSDKEQKIRASIQRDVQSICTEACHFLGLDITKSAVELVMDIFFHKMTCYADDLERFAKHAKRSVITSDDCRLLTRRNQTLTAHINTLKLPTSKEPAKRRRTTVVASPAKRQRTIDTRTEKSVPQSYQPEGPQTNQAVGPQTKEAVGAQTKEAARTTEIDTEVAIDLTLE